MPARSSTRPRVSSEAGKYPVSISVMSSSFLVTACGVRITITRKATAASAGMSMTLYAIFQFLSMLHLGFVSGAKVGAAMGPTIH